MCACLTAWLWLWITITCEHGAMSSVSLASLSLIFPSTYSNGRLILVELDTWVYRVCYHRSRRLPNSSHLQCALIQLILMSKLSFVSTYWEFKVSFSCLFIHLDRCSQLTCAAQEGNVSTGFKEDVCLEDQLLLPWSVFMYPYAPR